MDRHLITVDELRAAGALDVPAAWRKSLFVERDLFSDLIDDEDPQLDDQDQSAPDDRDDNDEAVEDIPRP
jgi:hypothetical protein